MSKPWKPVPISELTPTEPIERPWQVRITRNADGQTVFEILAHTSGAIACDSDLWPKDHELPYGYEPTLDENGYRQPDELITVSDHYIETARLIAKMSEAGR